MVRQHYSPYWLSLMMAILIGVSVSEAEEWRTYTAADGLMDNAVQAVAVDQQSSLVWFGTRTGLSRFDGAHWQSYLDGQDIQKLVVESQDRVWLTTRQGEGVLLAQGQAKPLLSADVFVEDIAIDNQGIKWFGTRHGLYSTRDGLEWTQYQSVSAQLTETALQVLRQSGYVGLSWFRTSISVIAIDAQNQKWMATYLMFEYQAQQLVLTGISLLDETGWQMLWPTVEVYAGLDRNLLVEDTNAAITALTLDLQGNVWYGTPRTGVYVYDVGHQAVHHYSTEDLTGDGRWFGTQSVVTVQDLDGNGRKEVVAVAEAGYDLQPRGIFVYDLSSGEEQWRYLVGPHESASNVVVGDVTGDGRPEIVMGGNSSFNGSWVNGTNDSHGYIFILDAHGHNLWPGGSSPPLTPYGGSMPRISLADLDNDGVLDIVGFMGANTSYAQPRDLGVIVLDAHGQEKARFLHDRPIWDGGVTDLNGDGSPEVVALDDQGRLLILDASLSLRYAQQVAPGTRLGVLADLYGDGHSEIVLLNEGRLSVLDGQWETGTLRTLWDEHDFSGGISPLLSDIEPGGIPELLFVETKGGQPRLHILGEPPKQTQPLESSDTGWRYPGFYSLTKTWNYPHTPSIPEEPHPFQVLHTLSLDMDVVLTGDVNGDGQLELISQKMNTLSAWDYHQGDPQVLWERTYPDDGEGLRLAGMQYDVIGQPGSLVILASSFQDGHPRLLVIDASNGAVIQSIEAYAGITDELRNNDVHAIGVDETNGDIWFGTNNGVSIFDGNTWRVQSTVNGLVDNQVNAIAFDASHNLWFATSAGVSVLDRSVVGQPSPLLNATPSILLPDEQGNIWCGSWGDGIWRYASDTQKHYLPTIGEGAHFITAFTVDLMRNALWASSWMGGSYQGLLRLDLETGQSTPQPTQGISPYITAILLDSRDGSLWLTAYPATLYRYDPDTQGGHTLSGEFPLPQGMTSLAMTPSGVLWMGSPGGGAIRFDTTLSGPTAWSSFSAQDGLAGNLIHTVALDDSGNVWFGTSDGASRYDETQHQWETYTTAEGLAGNVVYDIKAAKHTLYFATNGGVSRFDGQNWLTYDTRDGLPSNSVVSVAMDPEGNLWVGASDGRVAMRQAESIPPQTFILPELPSRIGSAGVVVEYAGADFGTDTQDLQFQSKLVPEGVSPNAVSWSEYTRATKKAYPDLQDGSYTFLVRAVDADGNVDPQPAEYLFTVDTGQPTALITLPLTDATLSGSINIEGSADDTDLKEYRLEYKINTPQTPWVPIAHFSNGVPNGVLLPGGWDTSLLQGAVTLRLTVQDTLGHQSEDEVNLTLVTFIKNQVDARNQRVFLKTEDGKVRLMIPPNSLMDVVTPDITINRIPAKDIPPPPNPNIISLGVDYSIEGYGLQMEGEDIKTRAHIPARIHPRKPLTLEMSYAETQLPDSLLKHVAIFSWNASSKSWSFLGGTVDENTHTIQTAITEFAQFAVMAVQEEVQFTTPASAEMRCQPQVFSPQKAGPYGDYTDISFMLEKSTSVTIKVYDTAGRLQRVLAQDIPYPSGMNAVRWDGHNRDGNVVSSGAYIITVVAKPWNQPKTRVVAVLNQY